MKKNLPRGWKWVKLGDVGKYINGRAFKPEEWENKGLPIIRIQNLTDPSIPYNYYSKPVEPKYYVKNGDLLISWSATLDVFIWDRGDALLNQHIFRVEVNDNVVEKKFLFYAVKYVLQRLLEKTHGSTMKHVTKRKFENTEIPLPPLKEQKRIVAKLDETFSKIQRARKIKEETLKETEQMMQSALHKIFSVAEEKGWKWIKLEKVMEFKNGINFSANQKGDKGILTIDVLNMYGDSIYVNLQNLYRVQIQIKDDYLLRNGDILFVRSSVKREGVGWASLFRKGTEPVTFCGFIIRGRLKEKDILPEFLTYFLRSDIVRNDLVAGSEYVTITNINQKLLRRLKCPIPTKNGKSNREKQKQIVAYLNKLQEKFILLKKHQKETQKEIEQLTSSILDKAFRGELVD